MAVKSWISDEHPPIIVDRRFKRRYGYACYQPKQNRIVFVPGMMHSEDHIISVLMHELAHWTTTIGLTPAERKWVAQKYDSNRGYYNHEELFIEKLAFWISGQI